MRLDIAIDYLAPRLTRRQIHRIVARYREIFPELNSVPVDIIGFLEQRLYAEGRILIEIVDDQTMAAQNAEAQTLIITKTIVFPQTGYERLIKGWPRARFTAMHEVGHVFLHYRKPLTELPMIGHKFPTLSAEWQSNEFAAEMLMPHNRIDFDRSDEELSRQFGVSADVVGLRRQKLAQTYGYDTERRSIDDPQLTLQMI